MVFGPAGQSCSISFPISVASRAANRLQTDMDASPAKLLWMHSNPTSTRTYEFKTRIEKKYNQHFVSYEQLRQWSISNINRFWEEVWDFTGVKASEPFTKVRPKSKFSRF